MKKYVAIILMICLSASLLIGCGGSGGGDKSAGAQSKEEAQAETAQAEAQQADAAQEEAQQQADAPKTEMKTAEAQADTQPEKKLTSQLPSQTDGYLIFVRDANTEEPLAGVKVQFCSDTQCMMGRTDNTGVAVFNMEPGNYEAHILKQPEGYQKNNETAKLTATDKTAVFMLLKEGEELKTTEAADSADAAADKTDNSSVNLFNDGFQKTDAEWSFDMTGFTFKVPERFKDYKGQYHGADLGETDFNSEIFVTNLIYLPRTDEERAVMNDYVKGITDQEANSDEFRGRVDEYFRFNLAAAMIVATKEGMDFDAVLDVVSGDRSRVKKTGELGSAGGYTYYYVIPDYSAYDDALKAGMSEELFAEYQDVMANVEQDILNGVTIRGAHRAFEVTPIGTQLSFETTDLNGNAVSTSDLFAGHKVTMVNLWATWCTYCKNEMPELEELSKELAEKDCQIIGICWDVEDDNVQEAIRILEERGVTYTNIKATDEMKQTLLSIGLPTTYFVDSEGKVLTTPVKGVDFDKYNARLEEALKAVE